MAGGMKASSPSKSSYAQPSNGVSGPKVVGPNVTGKRETYQLVRRLQSALFGAVYEAKGLTSGRDFAIKVLHKSELSKAQESTSIEFCEVPLSEIRFAELMRGHSHVMEAEEHFEDAYCFYVVFELAAGGDLLEALKQKPHGFDEAHAQYLIRQAAEGLACLHKRQVAMQDVSLENMLLHVNEKSGEFQVKVCDPGQAVVFTVDADGEELPVNFRGLVGKSFRPPELHEQQPYVSTKVDSWCLGWSTFYLLTAQPLFMSADPSQQDSDWLLFQEGDFATLFQQKSNLCSPIGLDFIFRLLQIEPRRRMSITDALNHAWLADPKIMPVLAPKELLPESLRKEQREHKVARREMEATAVAKEASVPAHEASGARSPVGGGSGGNSISVSGSTAIPSGHGHSAAGSTLGPTPQGGSSRMELVRGGSEALGRAGELPSWNSHHGVQQAVGQGYAGAPRTPMMRVRSPPRALRGGGPSAPRPPTDQHRHMGAGGSRVGYVIATAHSPPPDVSRLPVPSHRTASPLQSNAYIPSSPFRNSSPSQYVHHADPPQVQNFYQDASRQSFLTPRSASRPAPASFSREDGPNSRGRPWTFRSDEGGMGKNGDVLEGRGVHRALSPVAGAPAPVLLQPRAGVVAWAPPGRHTQSPARSVYFPRSASPGQVTMSAMQRTHSPGVSPGLTMMHAEGHGFSWAQAPSTFSPRTGLPTHLGVPRAASPVAGRPLGPTGFAWSPEPPSPRTSPRSFSPMGEAMAARGRAAVPGQAPGPLPRWAPG